MSNTTETATLCGLKRKDFQTTINGKKTDLYILKNRLGYEVAITNYGGIRTPMPAGAVTLEDIGSMFPFKNYLCYAQLRGSSLTTLLEQLAGTKAFQAVSGCQVRT